MLRPELCNATKDPKMNEEQDNILGKTIPIWTPSDQYNKDDANEAIADAEFVIEAIVTFLKQTYQLEL